MTTVPVKLTFPQQEAEALTTAYSQAHTILEYGSGGSTILAASMEGKYVMSVESDRQWAIDLQKQINVSNPKSKVIMHHADIGPTGEWGRPLNERAWRKFYSYPTHIWAKPFFRMPDIVLIDGRFRAACFVATCLRISQPTTILFDDYQNRPAYRIVEKLSLPIRLHGRMAEFRIIPKAHPIWVHDLFNALVGDVTLASKKGYPPYKEHKGKVYPFNNLIV